MTDNLERALQERLLARSQVSPRDVEALRLFARSLPARRSFWRGRTMQWALSAAAVVLAALVAIPVINRLPGFGNDPSPTSPAPTAPAPTPSAPIVGPVPTAPQPTSDPTGLDFYRQQLLPASGSDVFVTIDDPEGLLNGAAVENARATMSVRWFEAIVEPEGEEPNGLRITWVGFARDEDVQLDVSTSESGGLIVHIVQAAPPPFSDGEGEDRVLLLYTVTPVDPADVEVTFDYPA